MHASPALALPGLSNKQQGSRLSTAPVDDGRASNGGLAVILTVVGQDPATSRALSLSGHQSTPTRLHPNPPRLLHTSPLESTRAGVQSYRAECWEAKSSLTLPACAWLGIAFVQTRTTVGPYQRSLKHSPTRLLQELLHKSVTRFPANQVSDSRRNRDRERRATPDRALPGPIPSPATEGQAARVTVECRAYNLGKMQGGP